MVLLIAVLPSCGSDTITGVDPGVTIYERDGFEGDDRIVVADIADLDDIEGPCGGDWSNCISSITLDAGWRAILYELDGFDGDSLPVITDISDLGNIDAPGIGDWDDRASSIRVIAP
jgi:hypothetical protein